jgi:hypothetical protein
MAVNGIARVKSDYTVTLTMTHETDLSNQSIRGIDVRPPQLQLPVKWLYTIDQCGLCAMNDRAVVDTSKCMRFQSLNGACRRSPAAGVQLGRRACDQSDK